MADGKVIYNKKTGQYRYVAGCGEGHGGYPSDGEARLALRLHRLGCTEKGCQE